MKVIGFCGAINSGKDTCCEYLYVNYPNIRHIKVAHAVQDIVATMIGVYKEDLSHRFLFDDRHWKENEAVLVVDGRVFTPRELMKAIGNGYRAIFGEGVWNSYLDNTVLSTPEHYTLVISDIRYLSDAEWVKQFSNSSLVYVQNDKAEDIFYEANPEIHRSESYLPLLKKRADIVLFNNFELNYLYDSLDKLI
jgi:dephospho-CoA kinase